MHSSRSEQKWGWVHGGKLQEISGQITMGSLNL